MSVSYASALMKAEHQSSVMKVYNNLPTDIQSHVNDYLQQHLPSPYLRAINKILKDAFKFMNSKSFEDYIQQRIDTGFFYSHVNWSTEENMKLLKKEIWKILLSKTYDESVWNLANLRVQKYVQFGPSWKLYSENTCIFHGSFSDLEFWDDLKTLEYKYRKIISQNPWHPHAKVPKDISLVHLSKTVFLTKSDRIEELPNYSLDKYYSGNMGSIGIYAIIRAVINYFE